MKKLKNRGQGGLAMAIASGAVVLIVVVIVLGSFFNSVGDNLDAPATAALGNVTNYTWIAVGLVAVGLVIVGGFGLLGLMGRRE